MFHTVGPATQKAQSPNTHNIHHIILCINMLPLIFKAIKQVFVREILTEYYYCVLKGESYNSQCTAQHQVCNDIVGMSGRQSRANTSVL